MSPVRVFSLLGLMMAGAIASLEASQAGTAVDTELEAFSPEEMARIIYLHARLGRARDAERISKEYLRQNSRDRQILLVICALYAEQGRRVDLKRAANRYLRHYPGDPQGLYYLSSAEFQAGHYTEAVRILKEIGKTREKGAPEPFLTDLAADTWIIGDWQASLEAHLELIRHQQLSPQLEHALRRQLDEIYRRHLDRVTVGATAAIFDSGAAVRPEVENESQLTRRSRLRLNYGGDYVTLRDRDGILGGSHYRQEASVAVVYTHDTLWRSEYRLGAWDRGALAGFRLDYERRGERSAWLEIDYNARAQDSLALEALNGRRHEIEIGLTQNLSRRTALTLSPYAYRTELHGHPLGHGAGVQWRLAHTLFGAGPSLTVGLRGTYDEFHATDAVIDPEDVLAPGILPDARSAMLVAPRFNRHGVDIEAAGIIGSPNLYRVYTSLDYDFERHDLVWGVGAELTHRPRKSIDLTLRSEYTTSGNGANADTGSVLISAFATFRY